MVTRHVSRRQSLRRRGRGRDDRRAAEIRGERVFGFALRDWAPRTGSDWRPVARDAHVVEHASRGVPHEPPNVHVSSGAVRAPGTF
jgi:hypothetical protein